MLLRRTSRLLMAVALAIIFLASSAVGSPSSHAAFPGNNGKIAFVRDVNNDLLNPNYEIFTMDPDGSNQTRLTYTDALEFGPSWSPDGTQIAYTSTVGVNSEIYVMNADGTGQMNLTNFPGVDSEPSWSPDGTKIAFFTRRSGFDNDIAVMNADGTGAVELTTNPDNDIDPAWSPDGSAIAFISRRPPYSGRHQLFLKTGVDETQLAVTDDNVVSPDWHPDGSKIAFELSQVGLYDCHSDILVINRDGTGLATLLGGPDCNRDPAWSPDGSKIAVSHGAGTAFAIPGIYIVNVDGSGLTLLAEQGFSPDWQPIAPFPTATPTPMPTATPAATPGPVGGVSVDINAAASSGLPSAIAAFIAAAACLAFAALSWFVRARRA